ncbi:fascin domain-containing protein [Sinomicrobium soli]|uniref:fascin domain-containing protein n=1 Tax=Sinomicrobium sp. N-1-3-6 TaxID=2219864 RepID=UPI000DCEFDBC|nr:RICIN domain-containing protein [Sinomicrobium sp. N-1-3-6]RAV28109.1 hypothetical protein DN748_15530 [Sinomicrobium sp. N-1-3-6]
MKTNYHVQSVLCFIIASSLIACAGTDLKDTEDILNKAQHAGLSTTDTFLISSMDMEQKILEWGHDIKQGGSAAKLTAGACQQIFQNGRFTILRIPIYSNAHNPDGSVRENYNTGLMPLSVSSDEVQWEIIPTDGGWFHLKNKAHNKYARGLNTDVLEIDSTSYTGSWTQWKLVDAGNGWYYLQNRGHTSKHLRADNDGNITLYDNTSTGSWTQWKLTDTGNGYSYITNKGQNKYLSGGGNEYDKIIEVINTAKTNGDPDLYASHKIYDNTDHNTNRNINFGPFYTSNGIDAGGFAASIDAFLDYIQTHTAKTVKYLAPRCELGSHWTPQKFVDVVNNLTHSPLIVSPEAAYAINSDSFWTTDVQNLTDIKSTHNKENSPQWPLNSEYDWDGETVGGNQDNFLSLVFKLHEAFYKGKVTGIVFWGQTHLNNTDDDNNNGPFRRELVAASEYNLVKCSISENEEAAVIAFATDDPDEIKVFYASTEGLTLSFDRSVKSSSVPSEASGITASSFDMPATGKSDYGSFIVEFN